MYVRNKLQCHNYCELGCQNHLCVHAYAIANSIFISPSFARLDLQIKKLNFGDGDAPVVSEEELADLDKQTVEYEITVLEERLKQMTPNMAAIEEYKRKVSASQLTV